ncbi:MAG: UPF0175 family protein [Fimbriimonadales bacterium]|nr:UPF0175 family protein [Fimbriimonadales bacterium]
MAIVIPDEIVSSTPLSEQEFLRELILWLSQRGYLSASQASELLGVPPSSITQISEDEWQAILSQIVRESVPVNLPDEATERESIYGDILSP